jgi:hypothetical protein
VIGGEPAFDGLRGRNDDHRIPLDHRLAGQHVPGLEIVCRQAQGAAPAHRSRLDDDGTPAAATLAAARLPHLDPGGTGDLNQQRPGRNPDGLGNDVEPDDVVGRGVTRCSFSCYASTAFM